MLDLNTFIRVMGHVPVAVRVEDLQYLWHHIHATLLIVPESMRCKLSCTYSSVLLDIFNQYEYFFHCILYMEITTCDICMLCLFVAIVLLCIWDCYTSYL